MTKEKELVMHSANGNIEEVSRLLKDVVDINAIGTYRDVNRSALNYAIHYNHWNVVRLLINNWARITDSDVLKFLYYASEEEQDIFIDILNIRDHSKWDIVRMEKVIEERGKLFFMPILQKYFY
jgi:hypothetical protein